MSQKEAKRLELQSAGSATGLNHLVLESGGRYERTLLIDMAENRKTSGEFVAPSVDPQGDWFCRGGQGTSASPR